MIAHLVLFKPRPDLTSAQRHEFGAAFGRAVAAIGKVRAVRIGRRVTHGAGYEQVAPDSADFVAMIEFDDLADLQAYLHHPAHAEVGTHFGQSLAAAMVYDFELLPGGLDDLLR